MSFTLQPASEDDLPELINIQLAAFADDPFYILLYHGRPNDLEVRRAVVEQTRSQWREDSTLCAVKCVDTSTSQIVGFASVKTVDTAPDMATQAPAEDETIKEKEAKEKSFKNQRLAAPFTGIKARIWAGGESYISFGVLAVHPTHQRRGLGTKLVQWGLKICDEAALPGYITASPAGAELYARLGFQRVGDVVNKARDFKGLTEDLVSVCMVYGVNEARLEEMRVRVTKTNGFEG
ncbi:hypothetical protein LTR86_008186 [Recurvomyces mirabilis]|nr:hypothetical protein LTR86_008186 [Recurvomyces mirabilis]